MVDRLQVLLEAWGLDPLDPIARFLRGATEVIPPSPADAAFEALVDLREQLAHSQRGLRRTLDEADEARERAERVLDEIHALSADAITGDLPPAEAVQKINAITTAYEEPDPKAPRPP